MTLNYVIEINGQPGIKINARKINETDKALFLNCEGDLEWFPKRHVKFDEKNDTVIIA